MNKRRQQVYDKSNGHCFYCGCELGSKWHIDHFAPIDRFNNEPKYNEYKKRLEEFDNLVPSCPSCNLMKTSGSIEQFRKWIGNYIHSLNNYSNQYKFAKKYGLVEETGNRVKFWYEEQGIDMSELEKLHWRHPSKTIKEYVEENK